LVNVGKIVVTQETRPDHAAAPFRWANGKPWGSSLVGLLARSRGRVVPGPWSFLLGAISAACVVVLILTGVFLTIWYTPSSALVRYFGPYPALRGVEMSQAYASTMRISFEVPGGLLLRQAHHWAALLLPAVLLLRLLATFFTGGFRKPRRWQWVLLFGVFLAALTAGWSGYALPDDLLAGTGLRIFQGVVLGVPVVGTWASSLIFGGEFPGTVLANLYPLHVVVAPVGLVLLALVRLRLADRQGPAQFAGPARTANNLVGLPLWPTMATKWLGMFSLTVGVIVLNAGLVEIAPIWRQGPSSAGAAGAGSQPDWYTAFLDGALRLVPPGWEVVLFDRTWTFAVIVPLAAIAIFFAAILGYPYLEQWVTRDGADHHLLDRPRDTPVRTGFGVAGLVFYGTLWAAGSADLMATEFQISFNMVIHLMQALVLADPLGGFLVAYTACRALQHAERERRLRGAESGVVVRLPNGGYREQHQPITVRERFITERPEPITSGTPYRYPRGHDLVHQGRDLTIVGGKK
jgi:ubiquinol-cytochrome c reductase cytochrome b subunit